MYVKMRLKYKIWLFAKNMLNLQPDLRLYWLVVSLYIVFLITTTIIFRPKYVNSP